MPILAKGDDVASGRKAKACHGRWLRLAQEGQSRYIVFNNLLHGQAAMDFDFCQFKSQAGTSIS